MSFCTGALLVIHECFFYLYSTHALYSFSLMMDVSCNVYSIDGRGFNLTLTLARHPSGGSILLFEKSNLF